MSNIEIPNLITQSMIQIHTKTNGTAVAALNINAYKEFAKAFGQYKDNNNTYYHFWVDSIFENPVSKYILTYLPIPPDFKYQGSSATLENAETLLIPLVISNEAAHPCHTLAEDIREESAGSVTCAQGLTSGIPPYFERDIDEFDLPNYLKDSPEKDAFMGHFYFIPVLLPNNSTCYLITKNRAALDKYLAEIQAAEYTYIIAIDNQIHPIDKWSALITLFGLDAGGNLTGAKIIEQK